MSDVWMLAPALIVGCLLGTVFYGGLWWTVRKGMASAHPARWFFGSFLLRMGIAVGGFYVIANGDWKKMLACLAGFIIARIVVAWLTRETAHAH